MKYLVPVILFLLLITSFEVSAQKKIYYELGSRFKGLQKEQIRIWNYEYEVMASFKYQNIQYTASFNSDSTLYSLTKKLSVKQCPAYILSFLNCAYQQHSLKAYNSLIFYNQGKVSNSNYEVVIEDKSYTRGNPAYYSLRFEEGKNPLSAAPVEKQGSDYVHPSGVLWPGETKSIYKWYGGSVSVFCDSLKKHIQIKDIRCFDVIGRTYALHLSLYSDNGNIYGYVVGMAPYWLEEQIQSYLKTIQFPKQDEEGYNGDRMVDYTATLQLIVESENSISIIVL